MNKYNDLEKGLCITCRHYIHKSTEKEFEHIADTEYIELYCEIFGRSTKEYFLMTPIEDTIALPEKTICEFWELWEAPQL